MAVYSDHLEGYQAIEKQLAKRREQAESVRGKDTPFRVEFRYKGSMSYQYFETLANAEMADDSRCRYSIFGNAIVERPNSRQIQVRGPRGGWKKHTPNLAAQEG